MQDASQSSAISESARTLRLHRPWLLLISLLAVIALQGCISLSSGNSPPLGYTASAGGLPMSIRTLGADHRYSQQSSGEIAGRIRSQNPDEPITVLALSGGGAGGAFGAGAIVGLTQSGKRPEFAVVTGVSAGPGPGLGPSADGNLHQRNR